MNFHVTPLLFKVSVSSVDLNKFCNSSAAAIYVDALSEIRIFGKDLRLLKRLNACRNVATDKSVTISRCTALLTPHVKRHTYTLFSCPLSRTYIAPVKSTPVYSNGGALCILSLMSGGGSGIRYGLPWTL